jgi:hypothetical protein
MPEEEELLEAVYARFDAICGAVRQPEAGETLPKVHYSAPSPTSATSPTHAAAVPAATGMPTLEEGTDGITDMKAGGPNGMLRASRMPMGLHIDTNASPHRYIGLIFNTRECSTALHFFSPSM